LVQLVTPKIDTTASSELYARFVVEPLDSGFGTTLGNALRRVLLSSLQGAAVTSVRIEGIQHEFSTIPHIKEDTTDFLLNVKEIRFRSFSDRPGKLTLEAHGEGEVTAGDIKPSADYEIVNPELHLATMDSSEAELLVEFNVERGKGYIPAGQSNGLPIGVIPVDAIFTPVRRVNYTVERTRIGQLTNYDRLILEVWTDGSITPSEAVSQSAQILISQLAFFRDLGRPADRGLEKARLGGVALPPERYDTPIEELGLSVRSYNCLKRSGITKVGEVLEMKEEDLLAVRNFGRRSLDELKERLTALGFTSGPLFAEKPGEEEVEGSHPLAIAAEEDEEKGILEEAEEDFERELRGEVEEPEEEGPEAGSEEV